MKSFSFEEYRKVSPKYYGDLKQQLLEKYADKELTDIKGSKVIETPYGDTLEIVQKENKLDDFLQIYLMNKKKKKMKMMN